MRCKSCNALIFQNQLRYNKETNTHEDLCHVCRSASRSQYCYTNDKQYTLESQLEGMTPALEGQE